MKRVLLFISMFLFVGYAGWRVFYHQTADAADKPTMKTTTTATVPWRVIDSATLQAAINAVIVQYPDMEISVAMTDMTTGQTFSYGEATSFQAASVTKLLTAADFLTHVQNGQASLNQIVNGRTARVELEQLIVNSDNDAWEAFNSYLTDADVAHYAQSIGITSFDKNQNTILSSDIALLLTKLYKQKLLNADNTKLLLGYMKRASEQNLIVAAAPGNATVYHKAGWLDDRLHDAAIIDDGTHAYVLVIFSKVNGTYDQLVGESMFAAITKAANTAFLESH